MKKEFQSLGDWKESSQQINGFPAIVHRETEELTICGENGEIFLFGRAEFRAIVRNERVANSLCRQLGKPGGYKKGDEALLAFGRKKFKEVCRRLKISWSRGIQARLANHQCGIPAMKGAA